MIGLIRGQVAVVTDKTVIIDCAGVGWELTCASAVLRSLEVGSETTLYCEVRASEKDLSLIGFATLTAREIFRKLRAAPGVGTAHALSLLDSFSEQSLVGYILAGDADALTAAPGIGKKRGEQIIAAVKENFAELENLPAQDETSSGRRINPTLRGEAHKALLALGYTSAQAERALLHTAPQVLTAESSLEAQTEAQTNSQTDSQTDSGNPVALWVRAALQELSP